MATHDVEAPGFGVQNRKVARVAITTVNRLAASRLRYAVYIAELGKALPKADHAASHLYFDYAAA